MKWAEMSENEAQGGLKGTNWMKAKKDYQELVHSDQKVLMIGRWRSWTAWAVAKGTKGELLRSSPLGSDGSRVAWTELAVAKGTQGKLSLMGNYQALVHSY
jgi:hypothetical protein